MTREIYLAAGCFWGSQAFFKRMKGVISTEVGYANGNTANPAYQDLKQGRATHAETLKLVYDDEILPLAKILSYYLAVIDPYALDHQGEDYGSQYRTGIYYTDEKDRAVIERFLKKEEEKRGQGDFVIEVLPLKNYYRAEDYHQDYLDKNPTGYCHVNLKLLKKEDSK